MATSPVNPFNVTKAVDFSDQEINDYWVDIPVALGFTGLAKPTSPMPMFILGGKGSGKTHLMRYFSHPLQRIRYKGDTLNGFSKDGYIGVYLRCGGLNAARFRGKQQSEDTWTDVFAYYMELWLGQLALSAIVSILEGFPDLHTLERRLAADLAPLIASDPLPPPSTLAELHSILRTLQRDLDDVINNVALSGSLDARIAITRGSLVFGIPQAVATHVGPLRDVRFLYLIDEFENLSAPQQKYLNTLLRERQGPCSFRIGARMYGVRTHSTYSAEEDNKVGSEFEVLQLDDVLRRNDRYGEFARRLVAKRLSEHNVLQFPSTALDVIAGTVDGYFEQPTKSLFAHTETAYILDKYADVERPYFVRLRRQLELAIRSSVLPGLEADDGIDGIISLLRVPPYPLLEKENLLLFYACWRRRKHLFHSATTIAAECAKHISDPARASGYRSSFTHFKADLLAQLLRDTDQRQRYVGLDTFIDMSSGVPRNLLIILKHIFGWATFSGDAPFQGHPISIRAQQAGVVEASDWFYRDARMMGTDGRQVVDAINRLGTLFRSVRFSDKPSECSCTTFSVDAASTSDATRKLLDLAEKWSLLIDIGGQRDRNTERIDLKLQVNPMLAPLWDLPIYRRGALALRPDEVNAVFDPDHIDRFAPMVAARVSRMNAPWFGNPPSSGDINRGQDQGPGLFEE